MGFPLIQIFLKAPREGFVKTRLAATVGNAAALRIYRDLVVGQLARLPAGWPVEIHFTPADSRSEFTSWIGDANEFAFCPQVSGSLGDRLHYAVREAFRRRAQRVFCIGADCPELDSAVFAAADRALDDADVVFGPTFDGGYYLVGMKADHPELFDQIPWSTATTLQASVDAAKRAGLRVAFLPTLRDIDTAADL